MLFAAIAPISRRPTPALSGHVLTEGFWSNASGYTPSASGIKTYQTVANPVSTDLVTSTIELDYVGRGDRGGDLVIGSLSTGATDTSLGVQQFDITVKRDSNLEVISSTNNSLQVVNLVNSGTHKYLGAYERASGTTREGDLQVKGDSNVPTAFAVLKRGPYEGVTDVPGSNPNPNPSTGSDQDINGATAAQNNGYGFTDVKTINGAGFKGQLDLSAILTNATVAKYLNIVDQAPALANVDNVEFNYTLGSNHDVLDVAISASNLAAAGTTNREDFILNIKGNGGNDTISTLIYDSTGATWDQAGGNPSAATDTTAWYLNSKVNANLNIDGGSGNDTINTFGAGDWKVTLGTGDDTYYVDNSATGVNARAAWVFNTSNQIAANNDARIITNLVTGDNADYVAIANPYSTTAATGDLGSLFGLKLRVVYQDVAISDNALPDADGQGVFISKVIDVPTAASNKFIVTDLNINQAIKKAINDDPVLSKLLVATDGPANTLVVNALSDGAHVAGDLQVEFAIPDTVAVADVAGYNAALGVKGNWDANELAAARAHAFTAFIGSNGAESDFDDFGPNAAQVADTDNDDYGTWWTVGDVATSASYRSVLAQSAASTNITGTDSGAIATDNTIYVKGAAGDTDVVVLSTSTLGNDTLVWQDFNNGTVKVVNFATDAAPARLGEDTLDLSAYGATWLGVAQLNVDGNVTGTSWSVASYAANSAGTAGYNLFTGGTFTTAPPTVTRDIGTFRTTGDGSKYITLTRLLDATDGSANNAHQSTLYKIELWTVNGDHRDAYEVATTVSTAGDARDTAQLIGYVDVGRVIEGQVGVDSILANIAY